ncbi:MAG TPA: hypothetical protein PLQ54_09925 [Armatimonadota bacterium]|nr:hypothetical protein [Armatimonadota bacterium]
MRSSATQKQLDMPPITEAEIERFAQCLEKQAQEIDPRANALLADVDLYSAEVAKGALNLSDMQQGPAKRALNAINNKLHMILEGRR